jgi:hypothetical protein
MQSANVPTPPQGCDCDQAGLPRLPLVLGVKSSQASEKTACTETRPACRAWRESCTCTMVSQHKGFVEAQAATFLVLHTATPFLAGHVPATEPPKPRFQDLGSGSSRPRIWRSPVLSSSVFSSSRLLLLGAIDYLFSDISCITTSTYFRLARLSTDAPSRA